LALSSRHEEILIAVPVLRLLAKSTTETKPTIKQNFPVMTSKVELMGRLLLPAFAFSFTRHSRGIIPQYTLLRVLSAVLLLATLTAFGYGFYDSWITTSTQSFDVQVTANKTQAEKEGYSCVMVGGYNVKSRFSNKTAQYGCFTAPGFSCYNYTLYFGGSGINYNNTFYSTYDDCFNPYVQGFVNQSRYFYPNVMQTTEVTTDPTKIGCFLSLSALRLSNTIDDGMRVGFAIPVGTAGNCSEIQRIYNTSGNNFNETVVKSVAAQNCYPFSGDNNPPFYCTKQKSAFGTAISNASNFAGLAWIIVALGLAIILYFFRGVCCGKMTQFSLINMVIPEAFFDTKVVVPPRYHKRWWVFITIFSLLVIGLTFAYAFNHFISQTEQVRFLTNSTTSVPAVGTSIDCRMLSAYSDSRASVLYVSYQTLATAPYRDSLMLANPSADLAYVSYRNKYFEYLDDCLNYWQANCLDVVSRLNFSSHSQLGPSVTGSYPTWNEGGGIGYCYPQNFETPHLCSFDSRFFTNTSNFTDALPLIKSWFTLSPCNISFNESIPQRFCSPYSSGQGAPYLCSYTTQKYPSKLDLVANSVGWVSMAFFLTKIGFILIFHMFETVPKLLSCCCRCAKKKNLKVVSVEISKNDIGNFVGPPVTTAGATTSAPDDKQDTTTTTPTKKWKVVKKFPKEPPVLILPPFLDYSHRQPITNRNFLFILALLVYGGSIAALVYTYLTLASDPTTTTTISTSNLSSPYKCTALKTRLFSCTATFDRSFISILSAAFGNGSLVFRVAIILSSLMVYIYYIISFNTSHQELDEDVSNRRPSDVSRFRPSIFGGRPSDATPRRPSRSADNRKSIGLKSIAELMKSI
jgi:hypothetical protein